MLVLLVWIMVAAVSLPLLMHGLECLVALPGRPAPAPVGEVPPFAVLVPAHDEEGGIAATVKAVLPHLRACDRLLVVADNCTDRTAAIAEAAGASVVRRNDPAQRGKAHALAFGRAALAKEDSAVVIILDADCIPAPGALATLAAAVQESGAAVQGKYLLIAPAQGSLMVGISTFAFRIKNLVRQRGLQRLSGLALLQGTGMGFPRAMFDNAPLITDSLVEDMQLGFDLALRGERVRFAEAAFFESTASSETATVGQRTRWEHGQITLARAYLPRLLGGAVRRPALAMLALDVIVPPLAMLIALALGALALTALLVLTAGDAGPAVALLSVLAVWFVVMLLSWRRFGADVLSLAALLRIPLYIAWKLPIYAALPFRRQIDWLRTSRDA